MIFVVAATVALAVTVTVAVIDSRPPSACSELPKLVRRDNSARPLCKRLLRLFPRRLRRRILARRLLPLLHPLLLLCVALFHLLGLLLVALFDLLPS